MKNYLFILLLSFLALSCRGIEGEINFNESVSLNDDFGRPFLINKGSYKAEVQVDSKKSRVTLNIEGLVDDWPMPGDNEQERAPSFVFKVPANKKLEGPFTLSKNESGQLVDINGNIDRQVWKTGPFHEWEVCNFERWERRCYTDRRGRHFCQDERVIERGHREVEFELIHEKVDVDIKLLNNSGDSSGEFIGSKTEKTKDYSYVGYCR